MDEMTSLRKRALQLPWHHQIDLGEGVLTPGNTSIAILESQASEYFRDGIQGKSLIDIGCWDGYNSFEAHRRGARDVLATDHFAWSDQCWGDRAAFDIAMSGVTQRPERSLIGHYTVPVAATGAVAAARPPRTP